MDNPKINPVSDIETISTTPLEPPASMIPGKPKKTAADWIRDQRMSSAVNKATVGVDTDQVTPDLLLAASSKLLKISRGEADADPKDSLAYQRFYGPAEYFAEHVQRDGGKVARNILWKATNRGNIDFVPPNSLEPHISSVFYDSNLAQYIDGSTPFDAIDATYKTTRIGEGGLSSPDSAPEEMRTVQPSYFGYVDGVRCFPTGTQLLAKDGWVHVAAVTGSTELACLINGRLEYHRPRCVQSYAYTGVLFGYNNPAFSYLVTPEHRIWSRPGKKKTAAYQTLPAQFLHGADRTINCGKHKPYVAYPLNKEITEQRAGLLGWYMAQASILKPSRLDKLGGLQQLTGVNIVGTMCTTMATGKDKEWIESFASQRDLVKGALDVLRGASIKIRKTFLTGLLNAASSGSAGPAIMNNYILAEGISRLAIEMGITCGYSRKGDRIYFSVHKKGEHRTTSTPDGKTGFVTETYDGVVYCPTVPGDLVFARRKEGETGLWIHNSPERAQVGLSGYLTKNVLRGSDGKLYQKFINARTNKEELVDSVTAAGAVVASNEFMASKDKNIFALGGKTGVRIVPRKDVDYFLPRADEAYSTASNIVPGLSGIKEMRLLMGCLHPDTSVTTLDDRGYTELMPAKRVGMRNKCYLFGCEQRTGKDAVYALKQSVARFPDRSRKFRKVVLMSGRSLPTSPDHKWVVYEKGALKQVKAEDLKPGMLIPRSLFTNMPTRLTEIMGVTVTRQIAIMLARMVKTLEVTHKVNRFQYMPEQRTDIREALEQLNVAGYNFYVRNDINYVSITDARLLDWFEQECGKAPETRKIPSAILSLPQGLTAAFLDSYSKETTDIGFDMDGDVWLLDIPTSIMREGLSFMLAKIYTDTLYRDSQKHGIMHRALKLIPAIPLFGDVILDPIKAVVLVPNPSIMIDLDIDDNIYATGNGIITHNSKYATQSVPLVQRQAPLVRSLDEASGQDMETIVGRKLGTQHAPSDGVVTAVRKDRIDLAYNDGTKGSVPLYENFPANAKGWITNTPIVKAGQRVKKGQLLAPSNYTDDAGVAAMGRNLRIGYLSYKGGTYEDATLVSQSAAKKLTSTIMYKTAVDLDRTIRTGKSTYATWKPGQYKADQMQRLDNAGVVKPGAILQKGDPLILAMQVTQPSPGTMGKRIMTDVSQVWEHSHPGIVTDVVKTKHGIKVYATVTSPLQVGDKVSGKYGNKGTVAGIIPDEQMLRDQQGRPLDMLMSPLGVISRTNSTQLIQSQLGKVAQKTGKTQVLPQFMSESFIDYTKRLLKQNNIKFKESLEDPDSGRKIPGVMTGVAYVYKLKHIADTKMSGRGTDTYTAQGIPASGGQQGCFKGTQLIALDNGEYLPIQYIVENRIDHKVKTFDKTTRTWTVSHITDWFHYSADKLLQINLDNGLDMAVTPNHWIYTAYDTCVQAKELKPGDWLQPAGQRPISILSIHQVDCAQPVDVYDICVEGTHTYCTAGVAVSNSKRFGGLQAAAMVGHGAFETLVTDAKLIRGQSNADFWRSVRTGQIPTIPGEPLVHRKFFAHLQGAGMRIRKTPKGLSIFSLTNQDVNEIAGNRELKSRDTYQAKTFRPMDGGLFGQDIFGQKGKQWGYIQLDSPMPNPVMEEPLARLLRISTKDFEGVASGQKEVNGYKSSDDLKDALAKIDLKKERAQALQELKDSSASKRDAAAKRYVAIARMENNGVQPSDYMLDKVPVLPPEFRPVSTSHGLTMVADSNYLYAQLLDARNDARDAKDLPDEFQKQATGQIYKKWKELTGMYDPESPKLQAKSVKGLMKWALGDSPKWGAFQRKIVGATVDTVGRGVVIPDSRLKLNEVGVPQDMAWNTYAPFVTRALVRANYTPVQAMQMVKDRNPQAKAALLKSMAERPTIFNRAPSLHKLSLMGFNPVLTAGTAVRVNPSIVVPFGLDFDGDTANVHVPVSDKAIAQIRTKMMPQRNLISMRSRQILYRPQKEYLQGLYVATRMNGSPKKQVHTFDTLVDARKAYHAGVIDVDDPIIVKQNRTK